LLRDSLCILGIFKNIFGVERFVEFKNYLIKNILSKGHFGGVPRPVHVPRLLKMKSNIYDRKLNS